MNESTKKTVSLVLGSGGARGLAHIGIIHVLEERGYEIRSIAGCSVGALIGGIYAAGKISEYEEWVRGISKLDMVNMMDIAWEGGGLVRGDRIIQKMIDLVGDRQIEELPIRFTAVATELDSGREIWLSKGPLFDAIRSSCSLPLFFTPVKFGGNLLIDGGVVNPVPIAPTFDDHTDITIAVNLGGKPAKTESDVRALVPVEDPAPSPGRFRQWMNRMKTRLPTRKRVDVGAYDVAYMAFDAMQSTIARQKLAAYPPDLILEIPRDAARTFDVDRAADLIALGRELAEANLP
ncbi:MAG: patatin-like phospholipase family protein [Woeseiaceae bacterium]|nr:patatin-like phospholipase family protein [Woeseiaceae bacterium]